MIYKSKIPDHWEIKRLDEIGVLVSGGTPSTKEEDNWGEEIIWITPSDLTGYLAKTIFKGKKSISKLGLSRSSARLMPKGSVLFSSRAPIGYVVIAGTELCTNQGFKSIIPNEKVTSEYLFHFLKYSKTHVQSIASGTTFKEISARAFGSLKIPVPPKNEQQQIVEKIEELFSELDAGQRQLETVKEQLKIYKQTVLQWAFEGKLTNRQVVEGELPKGWTNKIINEIASLNPKLPFDKIPDDLEVSFLPMKLVKEVVNKIDLSEIKKYREVKKGFTPMTDGDVIFAKITPCMENGKIAVVHSLKNQIAFGSTEFHVLRCKSGYFNHYIFHYIVQEKIRHLAEGMMTGAVGQRRVPKKFLEELEIPFPPTLSEQHYIVSEIKKRLVECFKIEESINITLKQTGMLRQAILKKAFEGKLINI